MYSGDKEIYWITKTCCVISVLFATKCRLFHYVILFSISNFLLSMCCHLTLWRRNYYFFLILAHSVYKMWIIQEPNKLALWNKLHFEERKNREYRACLKYSVPIFVEQIYKMQRLEVSGTVRPIYGSLGVKRLNTHPAQFNVKYCRPVKVKQSHDRPWGFQEVEVPRFQDRRHMKVVSLSVLRTGRLYSAGNILGTHFC